MVSQSAILTIEDCDAISEKLIAKVNIKMEEFDLWKMVWSELINKLGLDDDFNYELNLGTHRDGITKTQAVGEEIWGFLRTHSVDDRRCMQCLRKFVTARKKESDGEKEK